MAPPDLRLLGPAEGFPLLEDTEIALLKASGRPLPISAERLADHIIRSLEMAEAR
jgi:hypothetical protein